MSPKLRQSPRRRLVLTVVVALAFIVPAIAFAWSQTYASSTYFYPDGIALSSFNQGLNYNHMHWEPPYDPGGQAGPHYGQVTFCDSSYQCYGYRQTANGFVDDYRSISYGRGKCHAKASNIYAIYVYSCFTYN